LNEGDDDPEFSRLVGERLRAIRKQKRLSLQDVEDQSGGGFKSSVVGAYERGERAVSLPRLRGLADFYRVPVASLLPFDASTAGVDGVDGGRPKLAIDLVRLAALDGVAFEMLRRFLAMIQVQRGDFNGKVLTVRAHDVRAIAAMLDVPVDQVAGRLDELGLVFRSS